MADKVTTVSVLKLNAKFADNDTRLLTVDNPKDDLTAADIKAVETVTKTTQAILGDKGGADFVAYDSAKKIVQTTRKLDLNS